MDNFSISWLSIGWVIGWIAGLQVGALIQKKSIEKVWGPDWRTNVLRGENQK